MWILSKTSCTTVTILKNKLSERQIRAEIASMKGHAGLHKQ